MKGGSSKIIAGFRPRWEQLAADQHDFPATRRCRRCGVRKLLERGFYRDRTCRGGYRQVCKKCRNRERAQWARLRYVPKTGRRYVTEGDRKGAAAPREPETAPKSHNHSQNPRKHWLKISAAGETK